MDEVTPHSALTGLRRGAGSSSAPMFIRALSVPLLGEKVGLRCGDSDRSHAGNHLTAPLTISVNGKLNGSARSKRLPSGRSAPTGPGLPVHSTSPSA
jgi:hypothetical protein